MLCRGIILYQNMEDEEYAIRMIIFEFCYNTSTSNIQNNGYFQKHLLLVLYTIISSREWKRYIFELLFFNIIVE